MNEDLFIQKIIKLEADVEQIKETMATKMDLRTLMDGQDKMIRILERVDQERVFTNTKLDRLENEVKQIKHLLHLDPA